MHELKRYTSDEKRNGVDGCNRLKAECSPIPMFCLEKKREYACIIQESREISTCVRLQPCRLHQCRVYGI